MSNNFYLLVIGYFITNLGVRIGYTGQLLNSYSITKTVLGVSILLLSKMLITMLFNPIIFKIIDNKSKKNMILICQVTNILISILLIRFSQNYYLFVLFSTLISLNNAFFTPAFRGIVPLIVHKDKIAKANSCISLSESLLSLVGFSIAGLLSFTISYNSTFFVDGFTSLLAIVILFNIKEIAAKKENNKEKSKGLNYLSFYKKINNEMLFPTWNFYFWIVGGFISATEIPFVKTFIALDDRAIGILLSSSALGGILISKLFSSIIKVEKDILEKMYKISFIGIFLIPIIYSYTSLLWVALFVSFFNGFTFVFLKLTVSTFINSFYDIGEQGKIFSILHMVNHTGMAIGITLSGILEKYINLLRLYQFFSLTILVIFLVNTFVVFNRNNKLQFQKFLGAISVNKYVKNSERKTP